MAPGVRFLHAVGLGVLRRERGEHALGEIAVRANGVQRLERLVREVEYVAGADVAMVGRSREQHPRELPVVRPRAHCGDDAALGTVGVAHLDELPEPAGEDVDVGLVTGQRPDGEPRRHAVGVGGDCGQPMVQRVRAVVRIEQREHVDEAAVDGQPLSETRCAVPRSEVEPDPERLDRVGAAFDEPDHGLRDHERRVPLETVVQPGAAQRERVAERCQIDPDVAPSRSSTGKHAQLVGPLVERASGGHVETGVVPVAGEDAVVQRPAMEREAHVRAAVVDGTHVVAVGEEGERVAVHVGDERAEPTDVVERRRSLEGGGRGSHVPRIGGRVRPAHRPGGRTPLLLSTYSNRHSSTSATGT